ncbi:CK5P3 protein, partial [Erpornis zantholeuca]|nr:CK5P3 protein [Erpornis zantholeuca]
DVRQELLAQVQALPSLLSRVGDGASALGEAIELYQACVAFVCDRVLGDLFPQIDWGDFPAEPPQGGDSDRGVAAEPGPQVGDIPQGCPQIPSGVTLCHLLSPSIPQGDDGIDWGDGEKGSITVEPGPQVGRGYRAGPLLAHPGVIPLPPPFGGPTPAAPEGVARGSDALTLLENPETRNQFIDELMELELFLAQRLLELEDEADVVAMSQLQLAPPVLQGQSGDRVRAQLATARELLAQLCSRSVQHLCMILASPR